MSVSRDEVAHFAALAKLELVDEELDGLTGELNDILEYVRTLQELPEAGSSTDDADERAGIRPEEGAKDELAFGPEEMAPRWHEGHFVVPPPPGVQRAEPDG